MQEQEIPDLVVPLQYFIMIMYRHQLLLVGGTYVNSNRTRVRRNEILKYFPTTELASGHWEPFMTLSLARSSFDCQVIFPDNTYFVDITKKPNEDLYCFGGLTENWRWSW